MRCFVKITMEVCIMTWEEAKQEIKKHVKAGVNLKTKNSMKRKVLAAPPPDFRVQIGKRKSRFVDITWDMLEKCWRELNQTGRYDTKVFGKYYPKKKKQHPCYVHVVGKIFEKAGLVYSVNDKFYVLK